MKSPPKYRLYGKRLLTSRKRAGLSAEVVAAEVGDFTAGSLRRYERGELMAGGELLLKLSRIYGESVEYLLTGKRAA